jgi:hypothetical protein
VDARYNADQPKDKVERRRLLEAEAKTTTALRSQAPPDEPEIVIGNVELDAADHKDDKRVDREDEMHNETNQTGREAADKPGDGKLRAERKRLLPEALEQDVAEERRGDGEEEPEHQIITP